MNTSNGIISETSKISSAALVAKLRDPVTAKWFDHLIKRLREIADSETLSSDDAELLSAVFAHYVPREIGLRSQLEFLFDKLSVR